MLLAMYKPHARVFRNASRSCFGSMVRNAKELDSIKRIATKVAHVLLYWNYECTSTQSRLMRWRGGQFKDRVRATVEVIGGEREG